MLTINSDPGLATVNAFRLGNKPAGLQAAFSRFVTWTPESDSCPSIRFHSQISNVLSRDVQENHLKAQYYCRQRSTDGNHSGVAGGSPL